MNDHLMADEWTAPRRIVVGVDGSPNSVAALRRAVTQAGRRHAELELVYVVAPGAGRLAIEAGTQQRRDVVGRAHSEEGNLLGGVTVPRCLDRALCPVDICADQAAHVS